MWAQWVRYKLGSVSHMGVARGGAKNFGLGGLRLDYLVVSHNSRKTQNAMYMSLCIGLINVILIST